MKNCIWVNLMAESRIKNTKRNIVTGLIQQIINIVLPFIVRTMVLYILGEQYQGLNGLFNSVLSVLNLSEFGFSSAVIFILYKPISEENTDLICAIMAYLKKIYHIVGGVILIIGLSLMPFLKYLINGSSPEDVNIYILYTIYLSNSAISYFLFAYKIALITAMQRKDIINVITLVIKTTMQLSQIAVLIVFQSYYCFIILLPIFTVINNLLTEYVSRRIFPEIKPGGDIPDTVKKELIKQVKGIFIDKINDTARNGVDNIFISALRGLTSVAIYNNYYYIYSAIYAVSLVIANSMSASIGNSIATETKEKNYNDLCKFTFLFSWFTGWCTVCMFCLYQDFMLIWMRGNTSLILPDFDMMLFCIYFYAISMNSIRNQYIEGNGLLWKLRLINILEATTNIILNFILGLYFGISGVIFATLFTIILFNFILRTNILFKHYFETSPSEFYIQNAVNIMTTSLISIFTYIICLNIPIEGIGAFIIKIIICLIIPNIAYFLINQKSPYFKQSISLIKRVIHK